PGRTASGALGRVGIVSPAPLPAPQPCSFSFGLSKYPGPPCIPLPFSCGCGPSLNRSTFLFPSTRDRESLKGSGAPSAHLDGAGDAQRRFRALYLQLQHAQVLTARGDGVDATQQQQPQVRRGRGPWRQQQVVDSDAQRATKRGGPRRSSAWAQPVWISSENSILPVRDPGPSRRPDSESVRRGRLELRKGYELPGQLATPSGQLLRRPLRGKDHSFTGISPHIANIS
ncbi:uncharacterized protein, partial [Symphalangus syndactylus]|uniref:uncharacterized protein n=1 Tax=Symphalangus syndactylus TaxID=9590 RepID=UPI003003EABE